MTDLTTENETKLQQLIKLNVFEVFFEQLFSKIYVKYRSKLYKKSIQQRNLKKIKI